MKKTAIAAAILMAASGAAQAQHQWTMTGGYFDFYDASGNLSPQVENGGFSHTNVNGSFSLGTTPSGGSGSFSTTTPFSGAVWQTDFTGMYFGPTDGTTVTARFDWDVVTYADVSDATIQATCKLSGNLQNGCDALIADPYMTFVKSVNTKTDTTGRGTKKTLDLSTGYEFTLGQGQMAAGVFFDWSGNDDIPVLAVMQVTGSGFNNKGDFYMDIISVDADGDGVPGVAMQTAPFPGQTPAFGGRMICDAGSDCPTPPAVPVPAAVWLFGSGLLGLAGVARRRKAS